MDSSGQVAIVAGLAAIVAAALGCLSLPLLFELCDAGAISGPLFVGVALALATLLAGGVRVLLAKQAMGRLFIISAVLFVLCILSATSVMRTVPLELAAVGSFGGMAFSLLRWCRVNAA
jgi:hypothetical protein